MALDSDKSLFFFEVLNDLAMFNDTNASDRIGRYLMEPLSTQCIFSLEILFVCLLFLWL